MRTFLCPLVLGALLYSTPTRATTPTYLWSHLFASNSTSNENVNAVTVDPAGNVIVVGNYQGTMNISGDILTPAGADDIFIAKYGPSGQYLWSHSYGSTGSDIAYAVAVDGDGNIIVTGYFSGTVNFGSGGQTSAGNVDVFLARYFADGTLSTVRTFGSTLVDEGLCLAVDASNNIYLAGDFQGTVNFGGAALTSAGNNDVFLAKYTFSIGSLSHVWSKSFGAAGTDAPGALAIDASSNVLITGYFSNTVNFGGSNLVSAGSSDVFVAKFNSAGTHQWSQRFGGTNADAGSGIGVDAAGNVFVTGNFSGTANFGGSNLVSAGLLDGFLAKYSPAGAHWWSLRFGSVDNDFGTRVAADAAGNVSMTGFFNTSVNMGGGTFASAGLSDIIVAQFSPAGAHQWSQHFGGTLSDTGRALCLDQSGDLILGGQCSTPIDLGNGPVVVASFLDAFVSKFSPNPAEPDVTAITDIGNDQGRRVQIQFTASGDDNRDAGTPVTSYEAYRKQKAPPAAASGNGRALDTGWTFVGSVPAHQKSEYAIEAPTIGDTTIPLGTYNSIFFIRAASDGNVFYDSPPDSGASVDNLAPGVPGSFILASGDLTWNPSKDEDFDYFTLYGSRRAVFDATAVLINYTTATQMPASGPYTFYYLTATDFSGNEGKPAVVTTLSGTGETPQSYVLSLSNYPNPFNPRTTITYTVPSRGAVTVAVYDAHGGHVATLFDGERSAGAYRVNWDGRAQSATAASGVYFVRIEHDGVTRTKKMVLLK